MQRFFDVSSRMAPRSLARLSASSRTTISAMPACTRLFGLRSPALARFLSSETLAQREIPSVDTHVEDLSIRKPSQPNAASESGGEYVPVAFSSYTTVHEKTQMAIERIMNFKTASKVQHQIISRLPITGDIMVKAKTGTGKTAAFLVPAIESLLREYEKDPERKMKGRSVGCLIVSPTRELAKQICSEAEKLVKFHGWNVQSLIGGERPRDQLNSLARNRSDIVIGTPGRIIDFLTQQSMFAEMASKTRLLILDEADVLLQMGFRKELDEIIKLTPADRQTFLVSATMDKKIRELAPTVFHRGFDLIDCVEKGETNTHLNVKQEYVQAEYAQHFSVVSDIIHSHIEANKAEGRGSKVIVFLSTVKGADMYAKILRTILKKGESAYTSRNQSQNYNRNRWSKPSSGSQGEVVSVEVLHGKISQETRSRTSNRFRSSEPTVNNTSILVTTDVSARGVDYPDVSLVVQIGVPSESEAYIHRLGRTGRAGKSGEGVILLNPVEMSFLKHLKGLPIKESEKYTPEYIASIDGFAGGAIAHLAPRWEAVLVNTEMERVQDAFIAMVGFYQGHLEMIGEPRGQDIIDASASLLKPFNAPQPPLPSLLRASMGLDRPSRSSFGGDRRRMGGGNGGGYNNRQSSSSYGGERRSFGGDRKSFGGERKSFGGERRPFNGERRSFDGERKPYDGERKSFGDRKPFGERRPYDGERKSFGGERKPFDGERKPFDRERKPFDGERRSFDRERKSFGGERKSSPWIKRGSQGSR
ncbi:hypothetical protein IWW38_001053 [Coemansia aciculifera]|uniref:Uncharacterized protein n=1 Tax=Coemansia aciculifera TaxID=417176 RepID=A0ACC1M885_9FUNG|nr:hypothetical protein IWW38_001053 [Coemansia aciculifera]